MGFKEGDWICESCGDHQFARNSSCRKCGAPKSNGDDGRGFERDDRDDRSRRGGGYEAPRRPPPQRESRSAFKDGDWNCPSCGDHQFARNASCRKCGTARPDDNEYAVDLPPPREESTRDFKESTRDFKDGDWHCKSCGDHQFARNTSCRKCGAPKDGVQEPDREPPRRRYSEVPVPSAAPVFQARDIGEVREGDWECPACGDLQFSRNTSCRRCGEMKPVISGNNQVMKPGDWICPNPSCKDLQFEKNIECRKCGTPKPGGGGRDTGRGSSRGPQIRHEPYSPPVRSAPALPASNGRDFKAGDWNCPACGDHQFERNQTCRKCGEPKPRESEGRYGAHPRAREQAPPRRESERPFKPGDWSCPNCGDHQFGRNEVCRRCNTAKPLSEVGVSQNMRPGDWICPNEACRDVQFARNEACRRCGTPKPASRSRSPRRRY
eukprot:TRINITY_DN10527_c0_g1_i1.p1 TRINITY_DN10527_c0_g1~~TRINITY_DN10527_c0_g1_i1.p1  ORF type:complete len:437 (-),score=68.19 TRINITY_DN10527_c0_g1_i1:107-1417(-)